MAPLAVLTNIIVKEEKEGRGEPNEENVDRWVSREEAGRANVPAGCDVIFKCYTVQRVV